MSNFTDEHRNNKGYNFYKLTFYEYHTLNMPPPKLIIPLLFN